MQPPVDSYEFFFFYCQFSLLFIVIIDILYILSELYKFIKISEGVSFLFLSGNVRAAL